MIKVTCTKENGNYRQFVFNGHAGFAKKGQDIVCSAVSVLFINTFNSIEKFTDDRLDSTVKPDNIKVFLPNTISDKSKLLLDSLMLGLNEIKKEYSDYISITIKEV